MWAYTEIEFGIESTLLVLQVTLSLLQDLLLLSNTTVGVATW